MTPLTSPPLQFILTDGGCPALFSRFEEFFRGRVETVYGPQHDALAAIRDRAGLICEMVMEQGIPKGVIVYETRLTRDREFSLRSFSLLDPPAGETEQLSLAMLEHVKAIARARFAEGIVSYTVSPEERAFLERERFVVKEGKIRGSDKSEYELRLTLEKPPEFSAKRPCLGTGTDYERRPLPERGPVGRDTPSARPQSFSCSLKREYIEQILSGKKTFEGRVLIQMFAAYQPGAQVRWFAGGIEVWTKIVSVRKFASFEEMVKGVGYKKLLPFSPSEEHAIGEYHRIPGYSDKVKRFGAVAFEVEVIKPGADTETMRKRERSE